MQNSFWKSPFDEARFNGDYCRAMLMALVIHVFHKDWGMIGGIAVLTLCAGYAFFQGYMRFKAAQEKASTEKPVAGVSGGAHQQ